MEPAPVVNQLALLVRRLLLDPLLLAHFLPPLPARLKDLEPFPPLWLPERLELVRSLLLGREPGLALRPALGRPRAGYGDGPGGVEDLLQLALHPERGLELEQDIPQGEDGERPADLVVWIAPFAEPSQEGSRERGWPAG